LPTSVVTLLAFAFVLGVLIFVHELGHFLAAKRVGIRVLKFQLGFNPTILSIRRGDTEYSIGALPLGGYVKMAGDSPDSELTGRSDEFLSKTKWERFQVLIMGPVMNLLLAVVVLAFVLYRGAEVAAYQDRAPLVGSVMQGSPAAAAGLQAGDLIVSVSGRGVETWEQLFIEIGTRPNRPTPIVVQRGGKELEFTLTPAVRPGENRFEVGEIGVLPDVHPHVVSVSPGDPGERGGLKGGDVILAVNGERMTFQSQVRDVIARNPDKPLSVLVSRAGTEQTITVTPEKRGDIGYLGVYLGDESKILQPGPIEAVGMSIERNVESAGLIFRTVWGLITRDTSPKQLMGPIAIAQLSGESAQLGWTQLFALMAAISLNLGLLNLLPIPILDGGHITIMALEGIARRDFSIRMKEKMLLAGFVVLMMLMVTVIYNDLARISWIQNLMPWR
jgi:regulator of sigma E protease